MKSTAFPKKWLRYWHIVTLILTICLMSACSGNNNDPPPSTSASSLFKPYLMLPTGSMPEAVAIGDVNGDGRNDVVMTTYSFFSPTTDYKLLVFVQNSSGELNPHVIYPTSGAGGNYPSAVAIGDINNDGKNEVLISNDGLNIEVFSLDGAGGLISGAVYPTFNSHRVKIADLNNDGRLDVVGVGYNSGGVDVFYQNADGTLNAPTTSAVATSGIEDLKIGDVNNDGLMDIVLMDAHTVPPRIVVATQTVGGSLNSPVYYNFGDVVFPGGIAIGDVTGDGKNDVVSTYGGNFGQLSVFTQNGLGTLNTATTYTSYDIPEPAAIADLTADGKPDVIVLHGGFDTMGVYRQKTDGTLSPEEFYPLPRASHYNPHGVAVGDINGDSLPDVVIASYDNTSGLVVLYHK